MMLGDFDKLHEPIIHAIADLFCLEARLIAAGVTFLVKHTEDAPFGLRPPQMFCFSGLVYNYCIILFIKSSTFWI
jgi:hypothetical protein